MQAQSGICDQELEPEDIIVLYTLSTGNSYLGTYACVETALEIYGDPF